MKESSVMNGPAPTRPDIANAMPIGVLDDVEVTLETTSKVLGMYEAYGALAKQNANFETLLGTDTITVAVLEDLHLRASMIVPDAAGVADRGHTDGFVQLMRLQFEGQALDLGSLRDAATDAISGGWNIEEEQPLFGFDPDPVVDDPFAPMDPDATYDADAEKDGTEIDF